jgi:hypothetical protein
LSDGFFSLDGGAMFGVVPKALWERRAPADARNRIRLGLRPLVVRGARTLIVDAGIGDKMPSKLVDIYGIDRQRHLDHALAEAGLSVEDIDIVLASHLHFDHAGGFTVRDERGAIRPRFPRAQYVVRRGEWEDACAPTDRNRASYLAENFQALADAGVCRSRRRNDMRVRRIGAYGPSSDGRHESRSGCLRADSMPTAAHLPGVDHGFDLPMETWPQEGARAGGDRATLIFFPTTEWLPDTSGKGRPAHGGDRSATDI